MIKGDTLYIRHGSYSEKNFKPAIEPISVETKNNRQKVAGSLKIKIPTSTPPTAPIPVQIAYAEPMGSAPIPETALNIRYIEIAKHARKPIHQ